MKKILLIEDDPAIVLSLTDILESEHFEVASVRDGEEGLKAVLTNGYDLVLLDQMLPSMNGTEVCRALREKNKHVPVIMLTSKNEESMKVLALEIGADDYITKPFSINELLARIKASIRRASLPHPEEHPEKTRNITLNEKEMKLVKNGTEYFLSPIEFKLVKYFFDHPYEFHSRNKLLDEVWGYDSYPTTRTIDNFILSLRKKFEDDPSEPVHFVTVHSAGYKFIP